MQDAADDDLDFPARFLAEADKLSLSTDDGEAWARFMYGDWFVCPTSQLSDILHVVICRRREYVLHGTDTSERIDILVESETLHESSVEYGFQMPHISLREAVLRSIEHLLNESGVVSELDKPDAIKLIDDIEAAFSSAIEELRAKVR